MPSRISFWRSRVVVLHWKKSSTLGHLWINLRLSYCPVIIHGLFFLSYLNMAMQSAHFTGRKKTISCKWVQLLPFPSSFSIELMVSINSAKNMFQFLHFRLTFDKHCMSHLGKSPASFWMGKGFGSLNFTELKITREEYLG